MRCCCAGGRISNRLPQEDRELAWACATTYVNPTSIYISNAPSIVNSCTAQLRSSWLFWGLRHCGDVELSALWEEGKPVTSGILVDCNKQALFHSTAWGLKLMGKERKLHDVAGEQGCGLNCGWQDIYNDNFGQWSPASLCTALSGAPAAGQSRPYQALVVWFPGLCSMQIHSCDEFTATETNIASSWCSCILQRR